MGQLNYFKVSSSNVCARKIFNYTTMPIFYRRTHYDYYMCVALTCSNAVTMLMVTYAEFEVRDSTDKANTEGHKACT